MTPAELRTSFGVLETHRTGPRDVSTLAVEGAPTLWGRSRIAIDSSGHRHVLVPVPPEAELRADARSAGIQLGVYTLLDGAKPVRFLDLACRRTDLFDVFATITAEVIVAIGTASREPDVVAIRVLDRWRALLGRGPSDAPTPEVLAGLWGELAHLRDVCRADPLGLACWRGPTGAIHDLRVGNDALEVKATLTRMGWRATINGLEQLEVPENGSLHFGILRLEAVPGGGTSVPALADEICAMGVDAVALHDLLARAGLAPSQLLAARDHGFRLLDQRVWKVDGAFPRLTHLSFVGGVIPVGVARIEYQLELSAHSAAALDPSQVLALHARLAEARA